MYRLIAFLGVVPDLYFDDGKYKPTHQGYSQLAPFVVETPWSPVLEGSDATTIALKLPTTPPNNDFKLLLRFGIMYGAMKSANVIEQIKHAGSARILDVR